VTLGTSFHRYTRHWRFYFLVALPLVRDLLVCAKHLFVAARTMAYPSNTSRTSLSCLAKKFDPPTSGCTRFIKRV
jgi:hypothetical protein